MSKAQFELLRCILMNVTRAARHRTTGFESHGLDIAFTRLHENSLRAGSFASGLAHVTRVIKEYGPIDCYIFQYCLVHVPRNCTHYTQNLRRAASAFKWLPHGKISLMGSLVRSFTKDMHTRRTKKRCGAGVGIGLLLRQRVCS